MGIIKDLLAMMRDDSCDGCRKPLTACNKECQAAAEEEAAWFHEIK